MTKRDNIVPLNRARQQAPGAEPDLFGLLTRLDELEEALETLDELGLTTRDQLANLIERLEAEAERLDPHGRGE